LSPGVKALAPVGIALLAEGRVACDYADLDGIVEQQPQHLEQIVAGLRRFALGANDVVDVFAFKSRYGLAAMLITAGLADVATHGRRGGLEAAGVGRAVVGNDQRVERTGGYAFGADIAHTLECVGVLTHEIFRPRDAGEVDRDAATTEPHAALAVAVDRP